VAWRCCGGAAGEGPLSGEDEGQWYRVPGGEALLGCRTAAMGISVKKMRKLNRQGVGMRGASRGGGKGGGNCR